MTLREKVEKALASTGGVYSADEIVASVQLGLMVAWTYGESILVGHIHNGTFVLHLAAGDLETIKALGESAYEWARQNGAERAVFIGRPGWERALADHEWEAKGSLTLYEKSL